MNVIKFYRRTRKGLEVQRVKVTQSKDFDRNSRLPTPAQAKAAWLAAGWTRDKSAA